MVQTAVVLAAPAGHNAISLIHHLYYYIIMNIMKSFRCFLSFLQMIKQHCSSVYFKLQRVKLPIALRLLSALFPRHCPVCAKLVPYGILIHAECQTVLPFISGPTCLRCGKPVSSSAQEYCYDCRTFPKSFQKGLSLFLYNKETRPIMRRLSTIIIEDLLIFLSGNFSFSNILRIIFTFIPKGIFTAIPEFMQQ